MAVTLVFLGRLEDVAGTAAHEGAAGPVSALIAALEPELARAVTADRIRLAVNGRLVADRRALVLADGDELAFLPPVSGG